MKRLHFLIGLFACLVTGSAFAQAATTGDNASKTQNIQTADTGWQVLCRFTTQDRSKLSCSMIYETYSASDRVRIASVEIVKGDKTRVMIVSAPNGVSLKDGLLVELDGTKLSSASYSHCLNNGCFSSIDITEAMAAALKKAKILSLTFFDLQGSKIKSDISMAGFALAYDKSDEK